MTTKSLARVVALLGGCLASSAFANTNTFAGVPIDVAAVPSYTENGIVATTTSGSMWSYPTAAQFHLDPSGFAGNTANFTMSGVLFTLNSVDISFASAGAIGTFTAYSASNAVLFTRAVDASVAGTVTFSGWTNVSRLQLVDSVSHLSIDNLVLTPVPEPATTVLTLTGMGWLAVVASRRRRRLPE